MTGSSASTGLAEPVERLQAISPAPDLVERLTTEGLISMKDAAAIYGRKTHKSTPTRHALRGVRLAGGSTVKLEAFRLSGALVTSRAAVLRFFAAQNQLPAKPADPVPTPKQRATAAKRASKEAGAIFGGKK